MSVGTVQDAEVPARSEALFSCSGVYRNHVRSPMGAFDMGWSPQEQERFEELGDGLSPRRMMPVMTPETEASEHGRQPTGKPTSIQERWDLLIFALAGVLVPLGLGGWAVWYTSNSVAAEGDGYYVMGAAILVFVSEAVVLPLAWQRRDEIPCFVALGLSMLSIILSALTVAYIFMLMQ